MSSNVSDRVAAFSASTVADIGCWSNTVTFALQCRDFVYGLNSPIAIQVGGLSWYVDARSRRVDFFLSEYVLGQAECKNLESL